MWRGIWLFDLITATLVAPPIPKPTYHKPDPAKASVWDYNTSIPEVLTQLDKEILFAYDLMFERHHMFCNGRWLGARVLQDPQDLMLKTGCIKTFVGVDYF